MRTSSGCNLCSARPRKPQSPRKRLNVRRSIISAERPARCVGAPSTKALKTVINSAADAESMKQFL